MTISSVYGGSSTYASLARLMRDADATAQGAAQGTAQGTAQGMNQAGRTTGQAGDPVLVKLSPQAQALALRDSDPAAYYSRFFPTRDGEPASALAAAVADPGQAGSSSGLSRAEVAADARTRMDARYERMAAEGQPFDAGSFEGRDQYTLMVDLDRRSLNAVATNAEGLFSEEEQDIARNIMLQQQGLAMGLYSGPTSQKSAFVDPNPDDTPAQMEAAMSFLDQVSDEEKSSVAWASARASAQIAYEWSTPRGNGLAEQLDSDVPLAQLIKSAMGTMQGDVSRGWTLGSIRDAGDLQRQPWFQGFEDRLPTAIRATEDLLGTQG
ncbi:hypothetical protein [Thalassobaculum salexigens]|uniref:hypothetical protein n=1 Tax=Thalassobaculum salexigens TaxID=455360 RepID=UPI0003FBF7A2|nr:hypothetical protein [Thalassobaculum salexigens]